MIVTDNQTDDAHYAYYLLTNKHNEMREQQRKNTIEKLHKNQLPIPNNFFLYFYSRCAIFSLFSQVFNYKPVMILMVNFFLCVLLVLIYFFSSKSEQFKTSDRTQRLSGYTLRYGQEHG